MRAVHSTSATATFSALSGKVYEKSRQNITGIFDIPHNAEDVDSEATEYVGKLQADGSVITDMGTGLKELAWARDLRRWKQEVEYSVARASRHAEALMAMISEQETAGLSMTRLLNWGEKLSFPLEDVFHIVRPFSEVFYFDRKLQARSCCRRWEPEDAPGPF